MTARARALLIVWTVLLLAPIAWATSLGAMFWLTDPVCQGASRMWIVWTGVACLILALVSAAVAWTGARRWAHTHDDENVEHFLMVLAKGGGALFALVIALSLVPVAMLSPCPL